MPRSEEKLFQMSKLKVSILLFLPFLLLCPVSINKIYCNLHFMLQLLTIPEEQHSLCSFDLLRVKEIPSGKLPV